MMYISADYILSAIQQISNLHSFVGITFLTCKKHCLPVGESTDFAMDKFTREFMLEHHKLYPDSSYFFQPYKTIKDKQWVSAKYPSSGLQAINTQTFASAFLHVKNEKKWGWTTDYLSQIYSKGIQKVPLAAIAVWAMKNERWPDTATLDDVIVSFIKEYFLTTDEIDCFFESKHKFPNVAVFQREKVTWNQLSNSINNPPDAKPEHAGTLARLELRNVGPTDYMDMQLSPRVNIITGDNGLGKTFLMDCAWWALTNTWVGDMAHPKYPDGSKKSTISFDIAGKNKKSRNQSVLYDNRNFSWKRNANNDTIPGLIIYALVDGSYAVWDPAKINSNQVNVFSKKQVWDGYKNVIEGLIRDWVKWQNTPDKYPFRIFTQVLKEMSPPDIGVLEPGVPIRIPVDSREIPTVKYPYGSIPVTNLSAGVGRIITLAYLMVWAWNEHSENCKYRGIKPDSRIVVMIDELEAHLHPKWQRTILPALTVVQKYLAAELEVQFIIATHSPLVMASAESIFCPGIDKIFQIKLSKESADAILGEEEFIKYGQINSWLTSPIFELGQARSINAENAIAKAKKLQLEDEPQNSEVMAVHKELLTSLAQNDPFWPRWIYFAEQHGVTI